MNALGENGVDTVVKADTSGDGGTDNDVAWDTAAARADLCKPYILVKVRNSATDMRLR
jgi:hypothetical protein